MPSELLATLGGWARLCLAGPFRSTGALLRYLRRLGVNKSQRHMDMTLSMKVAKEEMEADQRREDGAGKEEAEGPGVADRRPTVRVRGEDFDLDSLAMLLERLREKKENSCKEAYSTVRDRLRGSRNCPNLNPKKVAEVIMHQYHRDEPLPSEAKDGRSSEIAELKEMLQEQMSSMQRSIEGLQAISGAKEGGCMCRQART